MAVTGHHPLIAVKITPMDKMTNGKLCVSPAIITSNMPKKWRRRMLCIEMLCVMTVSFVNSKEREAQGWVGDSGHLAG